MDSNITFRDAGGYSVAVAQITICGVAFSPLQLLKYLWKLEELNDTPADVAIIFTDLLKRNQIDAMTFEQAIAAAVAAQRVRR